MSKPSGSSRKGQEPSTLLTANEVAEFLNHRISVKTLANWRSSPPGAARGPRYRRLGNRIFYPLSSLQEWMEKNEFESTNEYEPTTVSSPVAVRPTTSIGTILAEFDARVAELRQQLAVQIAELNASDIPPQRKRGRPRGSKDKAPRRRRGIELES